MAQGTVFSVNAVGFVNKTFPAGKFTLAANPLVAADNRVAALFSSAPSNIQIFKFNPSSGSFESTLSFAGLGFSNPNLTLVPGEAFYLKNNSGADYTVTFVGNVNQGSLTNSLSAGFNLVSSQVPQAGLVSTDLGLPVATGDQVFKFDGNNFQSSLFFTGLGWTPSEPTINVGEGFFVKKNAAVNWTRNFSVNN